jgi:hypothetical protein
LVIYDLSENKNEGFARFFPSKLAELFAAHRPILFVGNPNSQAAKTLTEMNIGVCAKNEPMDIAEAIAEITKESVSNRFSLSMDDNKRKLIDAEISEQAFVDMLLDV